MRHKAAVPLLVLALPGVLYSLHPGAVRAQSADASSSSVTSAVPETAAVATARDSAAIADLARGLVGGADTDSARAAVLYEWVARNVAYDIARYGSDRADTTPEVVFRSRLALCAGYVALFGRMATEVGLVTERVSGYAKGFDYREGQSTRQNNHSWLAVRIGDEWRLVDPTWGSGFVAEGEFRPAFSWSWFMVAPDELILSHHPRETAWQLVTAPLTRREFEGMAAVPRAVLDAGFTAAAVRRAALGGVREFPAIGTAPSRGARVITAPIAGTLQPDDPVHVDVLWPGAAQVLAVTGGAWIPLQREGDRFHGSVAASDAGVWIIGRSADAPADEYGTLLQYRVAASATSPVMGAARQ
jgi:hypothetical protein